MLAISRYWFLWAEARDAAKHLPIHNIVSQQRSIWPKCQLYQEMSQSTFEIPSVTVPSAYTTQIFLFFLHFSHIFTFLEVIKHYMLKCVFSSIFNIKMATEKFTNFNTLLKMHTDMKAATKQCNEIILNEVKNN